MTSTHPRIAGVIPQLKDRHFLGWRYILMSGQHFLQWVMVPPCLFNHHSQAAWLQSPARPSRWNGENAVQNPLTSGRGPGFLQGNHKQLLGGMILQDQVVLMKLRVDRRTYRRNIWMMQQIRRCGATLNVLKSHIWKDSGTTRKSGNVKDWNLRLHLSLLREFGWRQVPLHVSPSTTIHHHPPPYVQRLDLKISHHLPPAPLGHGYLWAVAIMFRHLLAIISHHLSPISPMLYPSPFQFWKKNDRPIHLNPFNITIRKTFP